LNKILESSDVDRATRVEHFVEKFSAVGKLFQKTSRGKIFLHTVNGSDVLRSLVL